MCCVAYFIPYLNSVSQTPFYIIKSCWHRSTSPREKHLTPVQGCYTSPYRLKNVEQLKTWARGWECAQLVKCSPHM